MQASLSDQGYEELAGIRESDNYLSALQASGEATGGGGRGGGVAVSFDAAYNITYAEQDVSLSPPLTAVEPPQFGPEGISYAPPEDERTSVIAALEALSESERAEAEIRGSFDDLLLGPSSDGPFPEPVGDLDEEAAETTEVHHHTIFRDETAD
jgi:hypothetical protein